MEEIRKNIPDNDAFQSIRLTEGGASEMERMSTDQNVDGLLDHSPIAFGVSASELKEKGFKPRQFAEAVEVGSADKVGSFRVVEHKRAAMKRSLEEDRKSLTSASEQKIQIIDSGVIESKVLSRPQEERAFVAKPVIESVAASEVNIGADTYSDPPEEFNKEAVKSFDDYGSQKLEGVSNSERSRGQGPSADGHKSSMPRSQIRGVSHPQPLKMKFGAFVTLVLLLLFPVSAVLLGSILLGAPIWVLYGLVASAVVFLVYLTQFSSCRCRVCGQSQFAPKKCRRHVKAHYVQGLGYIIPTALHMLLFSWFRCIFCGTSIRLKNEK